MRVYLSGSFEYQDRRVGYGTAAYHAYRSLKKLGADVHCKKIDDNTPYEADIEIYFGFPPDYKFLSNGYKIGYTPWESTQFHPEWYPKMNDCDEIWTTSSWCRTVFQKNLPNKPVFPYIHGINPEFKPKRRTYDKNKPFTFLFIGEPYNRKDGPMAARCFIELFGDNPEYHLIIKGTNANNITTQKNGFNASPGMLYNNITVTTDMLTPVQMIQLYEMADVVIYPTWGEGFGFIPLQAIAMGIPVITTYEWSDYRNLITMPVDSTIVQSPWQTIHPGQMYRPDEIQFKNYMANAKKNYLYLSDLAFKNSFKAHDQFDWIKVTRPAYGRLKKIYKTLQLQKIAC